MVTKTLFRPVGLKEMMLVVQSNHQAFPPRLGWQPIFYPVLNYPYAEQIACEWNTKDPASDCVGFVTAFDVESAYLSGFEEHIVGGTQHRELWVPAEELAEFNAHIDGKIRIVAVFYGEKYSGNRDWELSPLTKP